MKLICDRSSESSERVDTNDVVNDAKNTGYTDIVVIHDTDDTMSDVDNDDTIPDVNPDVTENVEFINLTFKTTTRFVNGELSTVDRTASVAYSDMFNPMNIDIMQVFARVQKEIASFVHNYSN